jgi:NADH-quinone oxidoreductase subunit N
MTWTGIRHAQKLTTATAAWDGGHAWLAIVVFVNTLVSLSTTCAGLCRSTEPTECTMYSAVEPARWSATVAVAAAVASLALGVLAGAVWALADQALLP